MRNSFIQKPGTFQLDISLRIRYFGLSNGDAGKPVRGMVHLLFNETQDAFGGNRKQYISQIYELNATSDFKQL